jgi:hypothetical protein
MSINREMQTGTAATTMPWLQRVRITALATFLLIAGASWETYILEGHGALHALGYTIVMSPLLLGYIRGGASFHPRKLKKDLALATGLSAFAFLIVGSMALLILLLRASGGIAISRGDWVFVASVGALVPTQAVLLGSAIKSYYRLPRELGDKGTLLLGFGKALALLAITALLALVIPDLLWQESRRARESASAVASLRTIQKAEAAYADTFHSGYSPALSALGPPPIGAQASASAADLISRDLAGGSYSGYRFTYSAGKVHTAGQIRTYTVDARPLEKGKAERPSLLTDQSGVIHITEQDRPATLADRPLEIKSLP